MTTFLIRYSGALPSGERWSTGVHVSGSAALSDVVTDAVTAATALWLDLVTHYTAATTLDTATVYELDPGTGKSVSRDEASMSHAGTASGSPLPQEVAVVASLRTATTGPAGRGRLYLPPPAVSDTTAAGRLSTTARDDLASGVASALSSLLGNALTPVLYSTGNTDRPIHLVDVGDVFDAQRRRRDKLVESRQVEPVS